MIRPNMSGRVADSVEKNDGRILATEAGDIPVITGSQTQRTIKNTRKARRDKMQREHEAKAAEYMNSQPASQNGHSDPEEVLLLQTSSPIYI